MQKNYLNIYNTYAKTRSKKDLLRFMNQLMNQSKFYSLFNATLISTQRPGCGYVFSEAHWKKYGFAINEGAKPIVILQPFGPVAFLYEQCDVTLVEDNASGKKLLERMKSNVFDESNYNAKMKEEDYITMKYIANSLGAYVVEKEHGENLGGYINVGNVIHIVQIERNKKLETIRTPITIVINSNHNHTSKVQSLLHELGHYLCGHISHQLDADKVDKKIFCAKRDKYFEQMNEKEIEKAKEYEAEMVSKIVSMKLGIENTYWDEFFVDDEVQKLIDMDYVIRAADKIEKECESHNLCRTIKL